MSDKARTTGQLLAGSIHALSAGERISHTAEGANFHRTDPTPQEGETASAGIVENQSIDSNCNSKVSLLILF
jgi:hypothetical protein